MYPTGQVNVHMGTLRNSIVGSSSTLHYHNGNCTWTVTINLGTLTVEGMIVGQVLTPLNSDVTVFNEYVIKCEVNDTLILDAEVTVLGELVVVIALLMDTCV